MMHERRTGLTLTGVIVGIIVLSMVFSPVSGVLGFQDVGATPEAQFAATDVAPEPEPTGRDEPAGFSLAADPVGPYVTNNGLVVGAGGQTQSGCSFLVQFWNFGAGALFGSILIEAVPDGGGTTQRISESLIFLGGDIAGGPDDLDSSRTYNIEQLLRRQPPAGERGYFVRLTVTAPFGNGTTRVDEYRITDCLDAPTPTATSTPEPTATSTPEPTATSTPEPTATSTLEPTATSTPEPTATSTSEPTATSTPEPTATSTPEPTATSTPEPTATATLEPTATSTPEPTATSTPEPTATSTLEPTATTTPDPTATSTPEPTATSTPDPTVTSTPEPTATSTLEPTATSTPDPTATSTPESTATSTLEPTATSTPDPTATSTPESTATSTPEPTATLTVVPTSTVMPTPTSSGVAGPPAPSVTPTPSNPIAPGVVGPLSDNPREAQIVPPRDPNTSDGERAGQISVMLNQGVEPGTIAGRYGITLLDYVEAIRLALFQVPAGMDIDALRAMLANDPDIGVMEANSIFKSPEGHDRASIQFSQPIDLPINDPEYGYELVGEVDPGCATGFGVVVAVLDTGIDTQHEAFKGRLLPGWNVIDGNDQVDETQDGIDNDGDGDTDEMYGHGTHVAGIVVRVAPGAMIMPIRVLNDDGIGDAFGLAQGIIYAATAGADVINLSLSSLTDSQIVRAAIEVVRAEGVVVIAATGNSGHAEPKEYPAAVEGVIAVAATGPDDLKSVFSNYGDEIRMSAPGTEIESALPGGRYGPASGTSMAAPFIAAAVALTIERYPDLTPDQVADRIQAASSQIDPLNPEYAGQLGAGRLDIITTLACG